MSGSGVAFVHSQPSAAEVADRLAAAMPPVAPRPAFVADLRDQLRVEARRLKKVRSTPAGERFWLILAGLGGIFFLFGLARAIASRLVPHAPRPQARAH